MYGLGAVGMRWQVGGLVRGQGGAGDPGREPWGPLTWGLTGRGRSQAPTLKDTGSTQQTALRAEQGRDLSSGYDSPCALGNREPGCEAGQPPGWVVLLAHVSGGDNRVPGSQVAE